MPVVANVDSVLAEWLPPLSLIAIATAYAIRMIRLGEAARPVPRWRQAFFLAGLLTLAVAYVSPIDDLSDELLTWHMVQHLLIMDVAALFFVLGLTGPLMQPLLAMRGFRWMRHLANPIFALSAWAILLYTWHIPALYEAATFDSDLVHGLQHLCFFFGVRLIGAVLANILMWSGSVIYARYASGEAAHGITGLSDQGTAGVVMMAESTVITLVILSWLVLRWAKHDTERQELIDLAAARGVELDPARAERAVNAGQGDRLRERIESGSMRSELSGPA
jgi:putative membrane protein